MLHDPEEPELYRYLQNPHADTSTNKWDRLDFIKWKHRRERNEAKKQKKQRTIFKRSIFRKRRNK